MVNQCKGQIPSPSHNLSRAIKTAGWRFKGMALDNRLDVSWGNGHTQDRMAQAGTSYVRRVDAIILYDMWSLHLTVLACRANEMLNKNVMVDWLGYTETRPNAESGFGQDYAIHIRMYVRSMWMAVSAIWWKIMCWFVQSCFTLYY